MAENWFALFTLANLGAYKVIEISSIEFAERIKVSQQTASRRLKELEMLGYISRDISHKGQSIRITQKGLEMLHKIYLLLHDIFDKKPQELILEGTVFSGLGEGAYYVIQPGYQKQFLKKLGFKPFPGTLNLRIEKQPDSQIRRLLEHSLPGVIIEGFKDTNRTFGSVKCFRAKINNQIEGAVLLIKRTHYQDDVLEVIAPVCLREKFNLKNGDTVKVLVDFN
ncbi:MAG: DUF120 domain-containing protein [Candidatus Helarchaeota archaeon]